MDHIELAEHALSTISLVFMLLYAYRLVFVLLGARYTRHFPPCREQHKYAIVIAARNEAAVIANLLDSIAAQDYPQAKLAVFVVADNCTDDTAAEARRHGAVCYERRDRLHCTKGFALQYLFKCINRDYGYAAFDAYMIFDADNLLAPDFVSRMNEAFDAGEKIVISYRATKNLDRSWLAASYALHWLRTVRTENRPRSVLRLSARVQGTGYLFANEVVAEGWNYTSLTEDRAFSADAVLRGYRISYNDAAIFYDEQPETLKIALRQRIRWSKGHLQSFAQMSGKLLVCTFRERSFTAYDMLTTLFPYDLVGMSTRLLRFLLALCAFLYFQQGRGLVAVLQSWLLFWLGDWAGAFLSAVYVFYIERERLGPLSWQRKLLYCATFQSFMIIGRISVAVALVTKVKWKPIPHTKPLSVQELLREQSRSGRSWAALDEPALLRLKENRDRAVLTGPVSAETAQSVPAVRRS
ncbi:glycosyltransferase family 2 protein [Oscillospiraceae bacterium HV4-5-C5C]|nr:glycosyltransferase family 2 protein [Oscillospiraceae bacterium HV4-5-C5C]